MIQHALQPPDLIEPLTGWRIFRFCDEQEVVLRSLSRRGPWPPGRAAQAICFALAPYSQASHSHVAPVFDCTCGLYAIKTEAEARAFLRKLLVPELMATGPVINPVLAEVALWGRVIEHSRGFRAEYAYPRRMVVPPYFRALLVEADSRRARRIRAPEAAQLLRSLYSAEVVVDGTVRRLRPRSVDPDQQRLFS